MKKTIRLRGYHFVLQAIVMVGILGMGAESVSASSLIVTPESEPLFAVSDLLPGSTFTKTIAIQNTDTQPHNVYFARVNQTDTGLASGVILRITDPTTSYFDDTFAAFFAIEMVYGGLLAVGETRTYTLTMELPFTASSVYQGTSLGFDVLVGFVGVGGVVVSGGGGGSSSSGTRITHNGQGGGSGLPVPAVAGINTTEPRPTPQILGQQVSVIPLGAPNTGYRQSGVVQGILPTLVLSGLLLVSILVHRRFV